jgi:hypothetical protein
LKRWSRGGGGALLGSSQGGHLQHQLLMSHVLKFRLLVQLTDFGLERGKVQTYFENFGIIDSK